MISMKDRLKTPFELEEFVNSIDFVWGVNVKDYPNAISSLYTSYVAAEAVRALMIDTLDYQVRADHARINAL